MNQLAVTNRQGFAPATITEAMEFSKMLADSTMVPRAYQGKPQDIMVCVQWGYEIGLAPMQALQNIAVINGKPSVYGDAAMALVQASPVCEDIEEYFENEGTPNPIAVCVAKRKGRKPVVAKFSVDDAKRAGLWGKSGPWQAYPKRMMQMRARGFALRDAFPDVLKGLITTEEAQDYPDEAKPRQVKDITPRNPLDVVASPAERPRGIASAGPDNIAPPPAIQVTSDPGVIERIFAMDAQEEELERINDLAAEAAAQDAEVIVNPNVVEAPQSEPYSDPPEHPVANESLDPDNQPAVVHVDDVPSVQAVAAIGYALRAPGKEEPVSVHDTLDEWQDAYEDMADKIAKAGKRPARERMTILKEFREANENVISRVDTVKRIRHTANYSKRLNALGASQ
jgi:hypothetical protein